MARHRRARRKRATFRPASRAGILQLPGDLHRPGLLLSALDHWLVRKTAVYAGIDEPVAA